MSAEYSKSTLHDLVHLAKFLHEQQANLNGRSRLLTQTVSPCNTTSSHHVPYVILLTLLQRDGSDSTVVLADAVCQSE